MITIFILYWMSVITFILYVWDKRCAYYSYRRIPESVLIWFAILGGAFGALMAMLIFRHKTKHPRFTITVPIVLLVQIAAASFFIACERGFLNYL